MGHTSSLMAGLALRPLWRETHIFSAACIVSCTSNLLSADFASLRPAHSPILSIGIVKTPAGAWVLEKVTSN